MAFMSCDIDTDDWKLILNTETGRIDIMIVYSWWIEDHYLCCL